MIYFNINLRNPWWAERFENIWNTSGSIPIKHKYYEVQIIKNDNLFRVEFGFTIKEDHAGVNLEFGILGYEIHFTIYDHRHWNYKEDRWMYDNEYGEQ